MSTPTIGGSLDAAFAELRRENAELWALVDQLDGRVDTLEAEPTDPVEPKEPDAPPIEPEQPQDPETPPVVDELPPVPAGYTRVYRNAFATADEIADVNAFQSGPAVNATLKPTDTTNNLLQKPSLRANVTKEADAGASDGYVLAVWSRPGTYDLPNGAKGEGWTNGRCKIGPTLEGPIFIRQRGRWLKPSVNIKCAVMWWPGNGQWPWEKDFPETFGGELGTPWGDKSRVGIRMHKDQAGDADLNAQEQLIVDVDLDGTEYHVYDMLIDQTKPLMVCWIDGVEVFRTTDPKWIAGTGTVANDTVAGFFSVGKALTKRRDAPHTEDAYLVDYVEFWKP